MRLQQIAKWTHFLYSGKVSIAIHIFTITSMTFWIRHQLYSPAFSQFGKEKNLDEQKGNLNLLVHFEDLRLLVVYLRGPRQVRNACADVSKDKPVKFKSLEVNCYHNELLILQHLNVSPNCQLNRWVVWPQNMLALFSVSNGFIVFAILFLVIKQPFPTSVVPKCYTKGKKQTIEPSFIVRL